MNNNRYREEEMELNETTSETEETSKEPEAEVTTPETSEKHHKKEKKLRLKIEALESEIAKLQEEKQEINTEMLKDRAELENFKRRSNEERIKDRKYALQDFLTEFINTIDIFDKATSVKTEDEKLQKYLQGFCMINQQIFTQLENYGVKKIDALYKPFDPSYHMAIDTVYTTDFGDDVVIEVVTTGYLYKDRVLRPAIVKVSTTKDSTNNLEKNNNKGEDIYE